MCLYTRILIVIETIVLSDVFDGSVPVPSAATHESCSGSWTNPSYRANWTVEGDCVSFYVSATTDGWVGLGFSLNRFMVLFTTSSSVVHTQLLHT